MIPRSLIRVAADRRHHTCLRDAREHCRPAKKKKARKYRAKKTKGLEPHPKTVSNTAPARAFA